MLDSKDLEILYILKNNSRESFREIAKKVGLSDVAVIKRVKKLEKIRVIRKYTILIDPKKLGYNLVSITGIDVEPEHIFYVLSHLKDKEYVKYLALTSGDHAVITTIWAKDRSELARIHEEIMQIPGVKKVCPAIILDVVKE